jgi:hypothetical protein
MLIPRYWARASSQATAPDGRTIPFHTWRASRTSQAEAEAAAQEAAGRIAARIQRGEGFPEKYAYSDRPLREEVKQELPAPGSDAPAVALTRNSYGALVLNAARVFFIDVDHPHTAPVDGGVASGGIPGIPGGNPLDTELGRAVTEALPTGLRSLVEGFFGKPKPASTPAPQPQRPPSTPADAAIERLRQYVHQHPGWSARVYRTSAGLRYLVTHALFDPTGPDALAAMQALGADAQYVQLCRAQKSFRARLTPKPWRIQMENPPVRFPFETAAEERVMRDWEARYDQASQRYATCQLVEIIGSGEEHPEVAPVVRLHDQHTGAESGRPLA